jgi:YVTN family beta-propeller protein
MVLDINANTVATLRLETNTGDIVVGSDGAFVYVVEPLSDRVAVISTATNTVTATIPVGSGPGGIDITPDGAFVYVSNPPDGTISVIDTATNTVTATLPVGIPSSTFPNGLAIDPTGAFAYVANTGVNTVSVISTETHTVVATVPVGSNTRAIAFPVRTQGPTDKDQCKKGGWQTFTNPRFKNQGDCVSFVNHMNHED